MAGVRRNEPAVIAVTEPGGVATGSRTQLEWRDPVATALGSVTARPYRGTSLVPRSLLVLTSRRNPRGWIAPAALTGGVNCGYADPVPFAALQSFDLES